MLSATIWKKKKAAVTVIARKFLRRCRSISGNVIYHPLRWYWAGWRSIPSQREISPNRREIIWIFKLSPLGLSRTCQLEQMAHPRLYLWYLPSAAGPREAGSKNRGRSGHSFRRGFLLLPLDPTPLHPAQMAHVSLHFLKCAIISALT